MLSEATVPAGTVTVWFAPATAAVTVVVAPFDVSFTVQDDPAGMSWYVFVSVVAPVPAGIVHSGSVALPQVTSMVIAPWLPAAGPLIVLSTCSEPGTGVYVSVSSALASAFG